MNTLHKYRKRICIQQCSLILPHTLPLCLMYLWSCICLIFAGRSPSPLTIWMQHQQNEVMPPLTLLVMLFYLAEELVRSMSLDYQHNHITQIATHDSNSLQPNAEPYANKGYNIWMLRHHEVGPQDNWPVATTCCLLFICFSLNSAQHSQHYSTLQAKQSPLQSQHFSAMPPQSIWYIIFLYLGRI